MPTAAEHALLLKKLLPEGPIWSTSDQTDGTDAFSLLLLALGGEGALVDTAAEELLTLVIPDTASCDLDAWERILGLPDACNAELTLSDVERLAAITGRLRGRGSVSLENITDILLAYRTGIGTATVLDRTTPQFRVGTTAVGQPVRGDQWLATWIAEYMANDLGTTDDFTTGWTHSGVTITAAQFGSPVTEAQTASEAAFVGAASSRKDIAGENGDTVRISVWVRTVTGDHSVDFGIVLRDGTTDMETYSVGPSWARLERLVSVGTGGSAPQIRIAGTGPFDLYVSWAVSGIVEPIFECQAEHVSPINTTVYFNVLGENG